MVLISESPGDDIQLPAPEQHFEGFERAGNSPGSAKPGRNLHVQSLVLNNMFNENAGVLSVNSHIM